MATIDPRTPEGERIGMSRYCDHLEARIAALEAALADVLAMETDRYACASERTLCFDRAREVLRGKNT